MTLWKTRLVVECDGQHAPDSLSIVVDDAELDPRSSPIDRLKWLTNDALDGLAETLAEHPDVYGQEPSSVVLFIEPQLDMSSAQEA